ncbi:transposase family protein [Nostoc sp.]|uniref:transposase family protein n=1 Tax=Nostoc sp. TaxID=1180 RepID=UPI002FF632EB
MALSLKSSKKTVKNLNKLSVANADKLTEKMVSIFSSLLDPHVERKRVHALTDILVIGILSVIAGAKRPI